MKAVETTGFVDEQRHLHVEEPIPSLGPSQVRVIVLFPDEPEYDDEFWLKAAASSPAFDFLKDAAEDIYSANEGEPFRDQG